MLHRAARNAYSWWWASHLRTKQSKWLDQNLQDMEEKVEYILKIIEEDADTFRQRAEMYYRKRPELVNFVEDSFRGYRALAERYDHLSKELQSANRTIASVLPESIHLPMDEDDFDGENLTSRAMPFDIFNNPLKNPPPAPEICIPNNPNFPKKNAKMPSRMMSRKGLLKTNAGDAAVALSVSGLNKSEALRKLDKLQKEILALQTEKEFVKSSYECGLEKYWNIEKQITEMQAEVSNLQDEFGIGTVIEDDEARTLMTATALKSCQKALTRLQEKQKQSAEEARAEYQKIEIAREKFNRLKENFDSNQTNQKEPLEENKTISLNMEENKQDQEVDGTKQNFPDAESLRKRIKEEVQLNLGSSLTMSELAEKVDDLVDKIINLESAVSSQIAHVKRLRSEANELQTHIQSLEGEKETLIEGSHGMSSKIIDLQEELQRVQTLNQCIQEQNNYLQAHCIEASCNLDDLSEKLLDVKPDEEAENLSSFSKDNSVSGVNPDKQVRLNEKKHIQNVQEIYHLTNIKEDREVRATSDANSGPNDQEFPSSSSVVSEGKKVDKEVIRDGIKGRSNTMKAESYKHLLADQSQNQFSSHSASSLHVNSEEWSGEAKDGIGTECGSMSTNDRELQQEAKEHNPGENSTYQKVRDERIFQLNQQTAVEDFLMAQGKATPGANPLEGSRQPENVNAPGYLIDTLDNVRMEGQGMKGIISFNQGDHLHNQPIKGPMEDGLADSSGRRFKKQVNVTAPQHNSSAEGHMKVESETDEFVLSSWENCSDGCALKGQVGDLLDANLGKSHTNGDKVVPGTKVEKQGEILGDGTFQSTAEKGLEEEMDDIHANLSHAKSSCNLGESSLNNQLNELPMNIQVKSISETSPQKEFTANEGITAPDISIISRDLEMEENTKKHNLPHQGKDQDARQQNGDQTLQHDFSRDQNELSVEDDDQLDWKELFLNGLDDREKLLLQEYTSILRNYKDARKKLNEVEKKRRASLFQYCIQIKVLKSANATKDEKIQSLEKKLNLLQENQVGTVDSREIRTTASFRASDDQSLMRDQKAFPSVVRNPSSDSLDMTEELDAREQPRISFVEEDGGIKVINVDEPRNLSIVEERIRTDIDELLEENIGFWMKFSTSYHQIQKFQTAVQDLQAELAKVKEVDKQNGSTNHQSLVSDIRPIYRHLYEIQTELTLWLDQYTMLKDDLDNRLSSLSSIQEEITRLSNAGSRVEETELSDYQAAKFQGEVLTMKQENKKVADELRLGMERAKIILVEIERTLTELDTEFGVSTRQQQRRNSTNRSKIPLRTFLFGVKLKKQKRSFFACISPSLQKQYSDLTALQK
ncbi:hypothetical protein ACH5RR_034714 [Cinchona calisaya]|uniref:NAB domain-containing protein n=1 Tax=Cinchona calisaya TaxID=153742 RepID=A0ABD2YH51_9GENT